MNMKRMISTALLLVMLVSLLAGCACEHEWKDADCAAPKTCNLCGQTEGEKTNDHKWEEATTEAPKTCSVCGQTEGEKINVDERFKTAACKDLFGTWTGVVHANGATLGVEGVMVNIIMTYTFSKDGNATLSMELESTEGIKQRWEETLYTQFADQGMSKEQADSAMKLVYDMGISEYAQQMADSVAESVADSGVSMVYYVEDGKLYTGLDWDQKMDSAAFTMEDGIMHKDEAGETVAYTKAEE